MICDACQSEDASIFLSQRTDGTVIKIDLCASCARKLGITADDKVDVMALKERLAADPGDPRPLGTHHCPVCGYTLDRWKTSGRLGCPACYQAFTDCLQPVIRQVQQAEIHRGKIPPVPPA